MLKGRFKQGSTIVVDTKDEKIVFRSKRRRKSPSKGGQVKGESGDSSDSSKRPRELAVR